MLLAVLAPAQRVDLRGTAKCTGTCRLGPANAGVSLVSIDVTPSNPTATIGGTVSFTALGTYSDGSTGDVTTTSTWTSSAPAIATNSASLFTCVSGGSTTARAAISSVSGTTSLTCQALSISPTGTLTAVQSVAFSQQFTASGGTPAYTFTSSDIASLSPAWLTLTSGGLLTGTTASLGVYNFHVTATDSLAHTTTIAIAVQVIAAGAEDNRYCNTNETTNFSPSNDGPATLPTNCNYTAIAATPSPGTVLFVCPTNQTLPNGIADANCNPTAAPPYYNSIQSALNAANCGQSVQIYPTRGAGIQNVYNENLVPPPTTCFGDIRGWITVETSAFASLPPPGTRITPAWAGQTSLPGRPSFIQPTVPGIYLPMVRCTYAGPTCQPFGTPQASAGISGWRIIGIEFSAPHGREPTGGTPAGLPNVTVCPNNFNGTPQCSPGYTNPLVSIGCTNFPASPCGATGATHVILDRILVHACDDKSDTTCLDQAREGIEMQGGQHNSIIDSYVYGFKTLAGIGPSVEGHGMGGGNDRNTADDGPHKILNNFLEGSSMSFFWGGGGSTSGVYSYDVEMRRNRLWKPLLWKINDPSFPQFGGSVQDAWVNNKGALYSPGTTCSMTAPAGPNPIQATCTAVVSGGQVLDVLINNHGRGYIDHPKFTIGGTVSQLNGDDTLTGWTECDLGTCAPPAAGGAGTPQATSQTINNSVPGLGDGLAMQISQTSSASIAQTNVLWPNKIQHDGATDTTVTSFTLDVNIQASASCGDAGQFEFDQFLFSLPENIKFMFGTQCNKTTSKWQVWDELNGNWVNTSPNIPCNYTCSLPHRLIEKAHRVPGDTSCSGHACLIYDSISWDGDPGLLGQSLPSGPMPGGWTSAVGWQAQINIPGLNKTVSEYLDLANFTAVDGNGKAQAFPLDGILNIKNCLEFKNGRRALIEGNICENIWKGQSDQEAFCILLTPKNANSACPTCTVQDATVRYNVCKNSNRGAQLGTEAASQCNTGPICLPDILGRISMHNLLFDGINPQLWLSKKGAFDGFGGGVFVFQNANPQAKAIQDIAINHITAITTSPSGSGASTLASGLSFGYTPKNTSAVLNGISLTNSILAGGVKANALSGCNPALRDCTGFSAGFQCNSASCSGGSVTALSGSATSSNLLPISGGLYTTGQVMVATVTLGGTCTVGPTSCSFTGGGGSGAACSLRFSGGTVTSVSPDEVGTGYTSAPAVVFSGQTCSVTPTATTTIGGIGNGSTKSWCYDHNLNATAAYNGEVPMTPYPTAQGDPTNNVCSSHGGGGNLTVSTWADVLFVNYLTDGSGSEIPSGDLHLQAGSPGHNAGNDGLDMGANMDLVLGKSDGSAPSPYTGITISNGVQVFPQ